MNVHHLAAIFVTLISYQFDFTRVGAMVKLMMDPADVPLHLAKMCLYMSGGDTESWAHFGADRIFEIFALLFFFTRIICYGYIVYATVFEATVYITLPLGGQVCVGLLAVLLGLQVFWFSLIVKLAISTKVKGEAIRDNRSDSEGDGDDQKEKKKRKRKKKTKKDE